MELVESYKLKINLDRAVGWMLVKIMESNLAPISVMPMQLDEYPCIRQASEDSRSHQNLAMIKQDDCYLTPEFLASFDYPIVTGRDYLRSRTKFAASKLGFCVDSGQNIIKGEKQTVTVKCTVGKKVWYQKYDQFSPKDVPKFAPCPFSIWYDRQINPRSGEGLSCFRMRNFDLRHSHPLSLNYS